MQIIIDIPEEIITDIKDYCGMSIADAKKALPIILNAIHNGVPLPKGHGRLGDLDRLRAKIFNASMDEHFMPVKSLTCDGVTDIIDDAPTIIEADTESEE